MPSTDLSNCLKNGVVYATAVYQEFLHHMASGNKGVESVEECEPGEEPNTFSTNESKGKIRDIAGWVVSEEIKSCISYISHNKCSKSPEVAQEVINQQNIKDILNQLKCSKDEALQQTKHPESLEHITLYDKGAKTYVTDATFEFFVLLASTTVPHLTEEKFNKYKQDTISQAYNEVQNSNHLKINFQYLIDSSLKHSMCMEYDEYHIAEQVVTCPNQMEELPGSHDFNTDIMTSNATFSNYTGWE